MMDKLMISLFMLQTTAVARLKTRREAGQGILEYVSALALALIVILVLVGAFTSAGSQLVSKVNDIVSQVVGIS